MSRLTKALICFGVGGGIAALSMLTAPSAHAENAIDMPHPIGYVNDFANILDNDAELEAQLVALEEQTTIELAVLTVDALQGYSIDEFATRLFEQEGWQWGKADQDNGIMIVIAPNDKKWRIEVGYGLQGTVTNGLAGLIGEYDMKPYFIEQQYSEGVAAGVTALISALDGNISEADYAQYSDWNAWDTIWTLLCMGAGIPFMILMIFQGVLYRTRGIWLGGVIGGLIGIPLGFAFLGEMGMFAWLLPVLSIPAGVFADWAVDQSSPSRPGRKNSFWYSGALPASMMSSSSGGSGGGFGGGGGGSSGGGGASGSW